MEQGTSLGGIVGEATAKNIPSPLPIPTPLPAVDTSRATATPRSPPPIQTLLPVVDIDRSSPAPRHPHASKKRRRRERNDSGPWYALIRGLIGGNGSSWSGVVADESLALAATRGARPGSSTYFAYAPTKELAFAIVKSETRPAQTCVHGPQAEPPRLHDVLVYTDGACKILGTGKLSQYPPPLADDDAIRGIECTANPVLANCTNGTNTVDTPVAPSATNEVGDGCVVVVSSGANTSTTAENKVGTAGPSTSDAQVPVEVMAAGYGVWFGESCPFNVSEPLEGKVQSAARAELRALIAALEIVSEKIKWARRVIVRMDANLTDARTRVSTAKGKMYYMDRDLWLRLGEALSTLEGRKVELSLEWVKGHAESYGNYRADSLADAGSVVKAMQINPFATEQLRRHIQFKPKPYEDKAKHARAWERAEKRREARNALRAERGGGRLKNGGIKKKTKIKRKQSSEAQEGELLRASGQPKGMLRPRHSEPGNERTTPWLVDSATVVVDEYEREKVDGMSNAKRVKAAPISEIEPDVVDLCTSDDSEVEIIEVERANPTNRQERETNRTFYDGHKSDTSLGELGLQDVSARDGVTRVQNPNGGNIQNAAISPLQDGKDNTG